jgi:hypothetical protein
MAIVLLLVVTIKEPVPELVDADPLDEETYCPLV